MSHQQPSVIDRAFENKIKMLDEGNKIFRDVLAGSWLEIVCTVPVLGVWAPMEERVFVLLISKS